MEDSVQFSLIVSLNNHIKAYFRIHLCQNLSLSMFLECSYFFTKSEADVLINSVLRQNTACNRTTGFDERSRRGAAGDREGRMRRRSGCSRRTRTKNLIHAKKSVWGILGRLPILWNIERLIRHRSHLQSVKLFLFTIFVSTAMPHLTHPTQYEKFSIGLKSRWLKVWYIRHLVIVTLNEKETKLIKKLTT